MGRPVVAAGNAKHPDVLMCQELLALALGHRSWHVTSL
jgi:hypothetical protein